MNASLKEFFYVDVDRTRSLLAQLQGGVIDNLVSETTNMLEGSANASLFGIGGGGGYTRGSSNHESRSLQEMVFVAFESLADASALITDVEDDISDPAKWESGETHSRFREGQLVRLTCDVQVLDGAIFRGRLKRLDQMMDGYLNLERPITPRNSTPAQRKQSGAYAKTALLGGISPDQLQAMSEFVESFVGYDILFRALACGTDHLALGFGGTLLGRREYIQEERESLFGRYGTVASSWTCVLQIAAIPSASSQAVHEPRKTNAGEQNDGAAFDRAKFEHLAIELLAMMERVGVVEGPRWPTISVTPLAVYRAVPQVR